MDIWSRYRDRVEWKLRMPFVTTENFERRSNLDWKEGKTSEDGNGKNFGSFVPPARSSQREPHCFQPFESFPSQTLTLKQRFRQCHQASISSRINLIASKNRRVRRATFELFILRERTEKFVMASISPTTNGETIWRIVWNRGKREEREFPSLSQRKDMSG